jgi:hypothetical protein
MDTWRVLLTDDAPMAIFVWPLKMFPRMTLFTFVLDVTDSLGGGYEPLPRGGLS